VSLAGAAVLGSLLAAGARAALAMLAITAVARLMLHCSARHARSALKQLWCCRSMNLLVFALWVLGFVRAAYNGATPATEWLATALLARSLELQLRLCFETYLMRTLFLHPPSFDGSTSAGARYQMKREVRSFCIQPGSRARRLWSRARS